MLCFSLRDPANHRDKGCCSWPHAKGGMWEVMKHEARNNRKAEHPYKPNLGLSRWLIPVDRNVSTNQDNESSTGHTAFDVTA